MSVSPGSPLTICLVQATYIPRTCSSLTIPFLTRHFVSYSRYVVLCYRSRLRCVLPVHELEILSPPVTTRTSVLLTCIFTVTVVALAPLSHVRSWTYV